MIKLPLRFWLFVLLPTLSLAQNQERNLSVENWTFKKISDSKWLPAQVPGTVHTDLLANREIPDLFFGDNEKQLQWIENEDWEYQTVFEIRKTELKHQNCLLQLEGLDTYATVFLNGNKILVADNMFRTWRADVKKQLKEGQNTLKIVFASAVKKGKEAAKNLQYVLPGDEKIFTRKAQYQYGWDWGPRFVTAGIWKPAKLFFWDKARIESVHFEQKALTKETAKLEFIVTIDAKKAGNYTIKMSRKPFERRLSKGSNVVRIPIEIKDPILWWPNGMGVPHQYLNDFSLYSSADKLDGKRIAIGLRTIELVQEKDAIGKSFYFKVNGVPVFMKGANYIPPDSFVPRATDSVYKAIVKNAADAHMNMLRVWGGGVYADDAFYNECDRKGILVWQDFMFACAMYPGDAAFLNNVRKEVADNVSRLQNHPCMALWCGNNESDEGWKNWGWQKQYQYTDEQQASIWNDYKKLFHEAIPQVLDSLLPKNENRYWPSSPSIGWGRKESLLEGDSHYWGVWWGMEPFEVYEVKVGRFMSEYGFQGMPGMETFGAFAKQEDRNWDSEAIKNHQKHPTGYKTINEYMARDFVVPKLFNDYAYVSQLLQAEGMKTAIEAHRRAKPNCMGTLYWQFNDCWPVTSWSSIDYFGRWKAVHYQVRKSYEDLLISVKEENGKFRIYLINDTLESYKGELLLKWIDFEGNILLKSAQKIQVAENSSDVYFEIPSDELMGMDLGKVVLDITFQSDDKQANTFYYFVKPKNMALSKPAITIRQIDAQTIEVSSDVLAKNVFLSADGVFFSDNYFDVLPQQKIQVRLSAPAKKINSLSLFDTLD